MHPDTEVSPSSLHPDYREIRRAMCVIGVVGQIDGHDVIRRGSVLDIIEQRAMLAHTPQPTTQFEAWAHLHHYDLVRCSHEPYAAYRSDLTNAALAGWRGANGEASAQADHSQCCDTPAYCSSVRRCTAKDAQTDERAAFEAWYLRDMPHETYLLKRSKRSYRQPEAYEDDSVEDAWTGWQGAWQSARVTAPQPTHYQQLLGVAYVVLGCLAENGVDIPERFLDAFSDPDSVENPLELLPCDFSPAQAVRAAVEAAALTDEQRESIREAAQCLAYAVTMTQDGYDGETGPASEWDAAAQRLAAELTAILATAPQTKFECSARKQGSVGGNDPADCDWPGCGCDEHANKVIGALEESGALKGTPIYQIGANAGGGIAWWDVDKDRYEREKKTGYMKTCVVYREGK